MNASFLINLTLLKISWSLLEELHNSTCSKMKNWQILWKNPRRNRFAEWLHICTRNCRIFTMINLSGRLTLSNKRFRSVKRCNDHFHGPEKNCHLFLTTNIFYMATAYLQQKLSLKNPCIEFMFAYQQKNVDKMLSFCDPEGIVNFV